MADVPTPAELSLTAQQAFAIALDPTGTGAVNLNPGSRNDTLISVITAVANRVARYVANRLAAANLSSAVGPDLDVLGQTLFNLPRNLDAASLGTVYLVRTNTGATSIPLGSRVGVPSSPGVPSVTFATTQLIAVPSGQLKVAVPVQCSVTGTTGNVPLSSITALIDILPDSSWQLYVPTHGDPVLNGAPSADSIGGGAIQELDDVYRARLQAAAIDDSRQRGTRTAILSAILSVLGVATTTLVEPGNGTVMAFTGDASYNLPSALAAAIQTLLLDWRAYGVPVLVLPYSVHTVTVTGTIYMSRPLANYDTNAVQVAAQNALATYFNNRPQPDEYFVSAIEAALFKAHPEVQDVVLSTPTVDQLRPADSTYGSLTALNRYILTPSSVTLTIANPKTS